MNLDLDDLAEQSIRDTPTRVPAMSEVRAIARRRARRRHGAVGAATAVSAMAVIAGGLWVSRQDDGTVAVITDGRTETSTATGQGEGVINGLLPNGDRYHVESTSLDTTVTGISAGIVLDDGGPGAQAVGVATFQQAGVDTQPSADDEAGVVVAVSGDWVLRLSVYDDVRRALGDDAATTVASWIDASDSVQESGLPSFELSAPLRWATDEELPLQMQVIYQEFVVRRGCGSTAKACTGDRTLQVIAADDVFSPAPPWPGGGVQITSPGRP
jgi:hypothetical protein